MKNKCCFFMLTFNRKEYIQQTIESLYKKAGQIFDLYVFDDNSDKKTQKILKTLRKKYKFFLHFNKETLGIYKNFYQNLNKIPNDYKYYAKLDSDVEILTNNFLTEMLEVFKYPEKIGGSTPRVEGIHNSDRYEAKIDFYGGHVIKKDAPIVYGCCLFLSNEVFNSIEKKQKEEIENLTECWGLDTMLYNTAKKIGYVFLIEDISVYHIDNNYGQRKRNPEYFISRNRWSQTDVNIVWYIEASKHIYPKILDKQIFNKIRNISNSFEEFIKNCKTYLSLKQKDLIEKQIDKNIIKTAEKRNNEEKKLIQLFKISSPLNFTSIKHMQTGTYKYFFEVPVWAKNNPKIVIEKEIMLDNVAKDFVGKEFVII